MIPFADPIWYSRDLSPYYNESHRRVQKETRAYVDEFIAPHCEQWEEDGKVPLEVGQDPRRKTIQRHARLGYMAASIYPLSKEHLQHQRLPGDVPPEEWDGFHDLIVIDEIARCGYLGVIWALACGNAIGCPPVVNFGSAEQKARWLPGVMAGKTRFCLGVTEPDAGSDVANITTTAERRGNCYVVNGAKKWITNGHFADFMTAAVRTGGEGSKGVSALVIPLNAAGVTCHKIKNSGVNSSGSTFIELDDVEVPCENLLGQENEGFDIIMSNFNHERLWLACTSLRMARVCAEDAYDHATRRETFGKKLIENQVIRAKISSFGRKLESAHTYMESLVYMVEEAKKKQISVPGIGGLTANLKVLAGQTLEHVCRESQQIMGGLGYARGGRGGRIEQISRDVRVMVVGGGSEEILTDLAAKQEMAVAKRMNKL